MNSCWVANGWSVCWSHAKLTLEKTQLQICEEIARMNEVLKRSAEGQAVLTAPIRIVVADDHPVVRFGVKNMLESEPGFEVVGEAEDGDVAITQTLELEPDILLLDVAMPRLPGIEAMRAIMTKSPRVKIILLTSTISTQQIIEALQIGARGIVLKDAVADHLGESI